MILVTGATGLLGSHLLVELTQKGQSCRALYRKKEKITDVRALFDYYFQDLAEEKWQSIEWFSCNLLNISNHIPGLLSRKVLCKFYMAH